jgi:hypothetical protein
MPVDAAVIGPATLSVTQSLALFQSFLPKFSDVRKTNPDEDISIVQDVRYGEFAAVILSLGTGAMISALTGSSAPTYVAAACSLGLVLLYESALRARTEGNLNA